MKKINDLYLKSIKPEYVHRYGVTNHLPMALLSLKSLGATDQHAVSFYDNYLNKLIPYSLKDSNRINEKNWENELGQEDYFDDYYHFFSCQCKKYGYEESLKFFLKTLFQSPLAAAFHSAIRVGYLIEYKKWEDVPFSLAYWASTFIEVPEVSSSISKLSIEQYNYDYLQHFKSREEVKGDSITIRSELALKTNEFKDILLKISVKDGFELARGFGKKIMEETLDFTALHLITGTYASHIISDYLNYTPKTLLPSLFATYLSMSNATKREVEIPEMASEDEVLKLGSNSLDDHVVKFCDTAIKEFRNTKDSFYLKLAVAYANKINL